MNGKKDFKVLIVDDEIGMCEGMMKALSLEGYDVETAENGLSAINKIGSGKFKLAFIDLRLPDIDGVEVVKRVKDENLFIVIITAYATVETAVSAMKYGAADYIKKPFDIGDIIDITEKFYLKNTLIKIKKTVDRDEFDFIYKSDKISGIIDKIGKIKDWEIPVLILGESGTGKELAARMIHTRGNRSGKPFIAINCAAIPSELLESELFGYEKGAFTGAAHRKPGKFEIAGDGILFLDEIGDMNLSLQAKLLRAIEAKIFEPLGSVKSLPFNARVIASTNQNLSESIKQKKFREDLYYRLNGLKITLPPLRDRPEDIQPLVRHFQSKFETMYKKENINFSAEAIRYLKNYSWPGNVRELKNAIESAILLSESNAMLFPKDFPIEINSGEKYTQELDSAEKEVIIEALSRNRFNRSLAAKSLKISRKTLYNKMKKYSIQ